MSAETFDAWQIDNSIVALLSVPISQLINLIISLALDVDRRPEEFRNLVCDI